MRTVLIVFLLGLFCKDVLALSDIKQAGKDPIEIVRNAVVEKLLDGNDARLKQEISVDLAFLREVAPERLGANIITSATEVAGSDFKFESSEYLSHVGVWVFSYRDNKTALRNATAIKGSCKGKCFMSKILTIFSYTVVENRVVIVFTENAGNESIVTFVDSASELFDK